MARGPKKHMKRLNAPSHWMLNKLGGIFVRPSLHSPDLQLDWLGSAHCRCLCRPPSPRQGHTSSASACH